MFFIGFRKRIAPCLDTDDFIFLYQYTKDVEIVMALYIKGMVEYVLEKVSLSCKYIFFERSVEFA